MLNLPTEAPDSLEIVSPGKTSVTSYLECRVGDRRIAVPMQAVERIADLQVVASPPLGAPWLRGLAMHRDAILPLVDIGDAAATTPTAEGGGARQRCLVLRGASTATAFCLSVTRVLSLLQVECDAAAATASPLVAGRDPQGGEVFVLRPDVVQRALHATSSGGGSW